MTRTYTCPKCNYAFSPANELSPREKTILDYLSKGTATKEIAYSLHISMKTVSSHCISIKRKLNLHSLNEVIVYAATHRINI